MSTVGQNKLRVDAFDKATGRAKYTDDLCDKSALVTRIVHSAIAHGMVQKIDTAQAEQVPGVVKIFTSFDVPEYRFPLPDTPGPPPPTIRTWPTGCC